jgi:formylmethanofuran dehydrogenase subunit D
MNEKIRELVIQANIYVSETALRGSSIEQLEDMKDNKLAELIVAECAHLCNIQRVNYTKLGKGAYSFEDKNRFGEGEISAHKIRISIKEQFGVV